MGFIRRVRFLFNLDFAGKLLLLEAFFYLGWARILVAMPFSKVAPSLGEQMQETPAEWNKAHEVALRSVNQAIGIISLHTPWNSKCLARAIAGMKMLERRRIESTLYLGTTKDENGKMIAHAWLRSGPFYVTGAEERKRFSIVGKFANWAGRDVQQPMP